MAFLKEDIPQMMYTFEQIIQITESAQRYFDVAQLFEELISNCSDEKRKTAEQGRDRCYHIAVMEIDHAITFLNKLREALSH